jgi:hypothetical protein
MDENHRDRPPAETFLLWLCMACPGLLLASWGHLLDLTGARVARWFTPMVSVSLFIVVLAGCCWFAGWILESGIDEDRRVRESFDTGFLVLVLQFLLAPMIAFGASLLFEWFY